MQLNKWVHKHFCNIGQDNSLTLSKVCHKLTVSINQFYSNDDFDMFTQVSDSEPHGFLLTPTMRRGGGFGEWGFARFASLHFCGDWCQDCYVLSRFTIMGIPFP